MSVFNSSTVIGTSDNGRASDAQLASSYSLSWQNIKQSSALNTTTGIDCTYIHGIQNDHITGDWDIQVDGNENETVNQDRNVTIDGDDTETVLGNQTITVTGTQNNTTVGATTTDTSGVFTQETVNNFNWTPVSCSSIGFVFFISPLSINIFGLNLQASAVASINVPLFFNLTLQVFKGENDGVELTMKGMKQGFHALEDKLGVLKTHIQTKLNGSVSPNAITPVG